MFEAQANAVDICNGPTNPADDSENDFDRIEVIHPGIGSEMERCIRMSVWGSSPN
jgi:hypothetical protein